MCTNNILADQLLHALVLGLALAGFGLIAAGLDRYAAKLLDLGASEETVGSVRFAGSALHKLDLVALLVVAAVNLVRALVCVVAG